jgi:predicted O-methyltransferase YrrM
VKVYTPNKIDNPKVIQAISAWGDIPNILLDIIERFNIPRRKCLEFGVEFGYSTSALANYFDQVLGVDTFEGDAHSGHKTDHFETTKNNLLEFKNIKLIKSPYQEFIKNNNDFYDFVHIDIVHNYLETFECGDWSINHSNCVIFHDTESFPEVKKAVEDLQIKYNLEAFNYENSHGLGILVGKSI